MTKRNIVMLIIIVNTVLAFFLSIVKFICKYEEAELPMVSRVQYATKTHTNIQKNIIEMKKTVNKLISINNTSTI